MSLQLRANSLDQLRKLLVEYSFCRILSVEDRASAEAASYEVTLTLDDGRVPIAFRTKTCIRGHTSGYKRIGPVYRCVECHYLAGQKDSLKRKYKVLLERRQELLVNGN